MKQFISPKEFVQTYGNDEWKTVQQYQTAIELANTKPDLTQREIANRVGCSQGAVHGWVSQDTQPRVVKQLDIARQQDWLEIPLNSERFRCLNQFVAWIYSGGGIRESYYVPTFSVDTYPGLSTINHLFRGVDIPYHVTQETTENQVFELKPSEHAAVFGRILSVLGAPRGVKADQQSLSLPTYLTEIPESYQRDFARVYLFNRGEKTPSKTDFRHIGINEPRPTKYQKQLREFFDGLTSGSARLGEHGEVYVTADIVHNLGGTDNWMIEFPMQIAYGEDANPITEKRLAATYQQGNGQGGWSYVQLYRKIMAKNGDAEIKDISLEKISQQKIESWKQGHTPKVVKALKAATSHGWFSANNNEMFSALNILTAWIFSMGHIRSQSQYPVFRFPSKNHKLVFERLADVLELTYTTRHTDDPDRTTEAHISEDGSVFGRLLSILGAPVGRKSDGEYTVPLYLYSSRLYAKQFVHTLCLNRGKRREDQLELGFPNTWSYLFVVGLEDLCVHDLELNPDVTDHTILFDIEAVLELHDEEFSLLLPPLESM
jgi:hypothetical protein